MAYFKILSQNLSGGTKVIQKNFVTHVFLMHNIWSSVSQYFAAA